MIPLFDPVHICALLICAWAPLRANGQHQWALGLLRKMTSVGSWTGFVVSLPFGQQTTKHVSVIGCTPITPEDLRRISVYSLSTQQCFHSVSFQFSNSSLCVGNRSVVKCFKNHICTKQVCSTK